jgi:hypothetical protein
VCVPTPFSKNFSLIPVWMTVSNAFWKSTKQANSLSFAALHLYLLLMIQFYIPWEGEGGYDENLK